MLKQFERFPATETTEDNQRAQARSTAVIRLRHAQPLAAGSQRQVFDHPNDSGLLIKVRRGPLDVPPSTRDAA